PVPVNPVGWRVYQIPLLASRSGTINVVRHRGLRRNRGLPVDQPDLVVVKDNVYEADIPVPHPGPVNPVDEVPEFTLVAVRVSDWDIEYRGALLGDNVQVASGNQRGRERLNSSHVKIS